mmetsp:Transcript_38044/g.122142  ORF Transcript_38044/g.122142 Transcript_38044/m.122142 type:complete len:362 (+) Transcript_38044:468-1553(+)
MPRLPEVGGGGLVVQGRSHGGVRVDEFADFLREGEVRVEDSQGGVAEFEEERRPLRQGRVVVVAVVAVEGVNGRRVQKFASFQRDARGQQGDDGLAGQADRREGDDRGREEGRTRRELYGALGQNAQRALRADEEADQVVAGAGFSELAPAVGDAAVGEDDLEPRDVLAHRADRHRPGSRRAAGRHATQRGVGAGVDGELQAGTPQTPIQRPPRHPRLAGRGLVLDALVDDPRHLRAEVHADAALGRLDVALQRRPGPVGHDRRPRRGALPHHGAHLRGTFRKRHQLRRHALVVRLVFPVPRQHRRRLRHLANARQTLRQPVVHVPQRRRRRHSHTARAASGQPSHYHGSHRTKVKSKERA